MERKILVALDGSIHDTYAANYIHTIFKNQPDISFTFATVLPSPNPSQKRQILQVEELETPKDPVSFDKKAQSQQHHDTIIRNLTRQGFMAEQFESTIVFSPLAPAQQLYSLGQAKLYDALLLARRGLDLLTTFLTNSTSQTLLKKSHTMPLWVLNGEPANADVMIPVDSSPHCMAAVDHLGFILNDNPNVTISLFHCTPLIKTKYDTEENQCNLRWNKEWQEQVNTTGETSPYHFFAAQMVLKEAGFPAARINTATPMMDIEPARAILRYSEKSHHNTIVLGRRPDTDKGFFKGVSDRVLANAKNTALWIVG